MAGGTAAECAAVCCCCPLTVMNMVVLVVYKVPTSLCRRVVKNHKKRPKALTGKGTIKKSLLHNGGRVSFDGVDNIVVVDHFEDALADGFEADVWDQFHGAGFWRSPSRREESVIVQNL